MTIYKPISELAKTAAKLAIDLAEGKTVFATDSIDNGYSDIPSIFLPVTAVDKNNMKETIIADGFHEEAEIYSNK